MKRSDDRATAGSALTSEKAALVNHLKELHLPTIRSCFEEPGAGDPHARFDERDVETEHGSASEAPATERAGNG